jgi:hypothetical protein
MGALGELSGGIAGNQLTMFSIADVAKLADAPDLGSGAARHVGSSPIIRTTQCIAVVSGTARWYMEYNPECSPISR